MLRHRQLAWLVAILTTLTVALTLWLTLGNIEHAAQSEVTNSLASKDSIRGLQAHTQSGAYTFAKLPRHKRNPVNGTHGSVSADPVSQAENRGTQLITYLRTPLMVPPPFRVSRWNSVDDLKENNWSQYIYTGVTFDDIRGFSKADTGAQSILGQAAVGTKVVLKPTGSSRWKLADDSDDEDEREIKVEQIMYVKEGYMVAVDNYLPNAQATDPETDSGSTSKDVVKSSIMFWSDLAYLSWLAAIEGAKKNGQVGDAEQAAMVTGLRYIERREMSNVATVDTIIRVLERNKASLKQAEPRPYDEGKLLSPRGYQNKHTFKDSDPGFFELVATDNVKGVCWLLVQHREAFGHRKISSITVWQDVSDTGPSMLVEIGPAE